MQALNNTEALGYDNLLERAGEGPKGNYEKAHESVFDKMMAEYFLQQRGNYKESNKMMDDLKQVFEKPELGQSLDEIMHAQNRHKDSRPHFRAENFRALMELDYATGNAFENNRNGLS